jgi:8-oxo-dGTP pyrophosphatase MutT (NUDIX family)
MTLAKRLHAALTAGHARDVDLWPSDGHLNDPTRAPVPAAVLIAVTDRALPGIILTQRPETMRNHAGQIAFPGGRVDPEDAGIVAAALREAHEEIALAPHLVHVIGETDTYSTITGFAVTPVIGVVPPDVAYRASVGEVDAIFEVPLAFLLDPANHKVQALEHEGQKRQFFEITWRERRIWGATAAMLVNLSRRLAW